MTGFHNCELSFEELANHVLPELFKVLMARVAGAETLSSHEAERLGRLPKSRACYVFFEGERPLYVGISRNLRERVKQHLSVYRSQANLCARFAASELGLSVGQAVKSDQFEEQFRLARLRLLKCKLSWIEVDDAMTLYLIEPFVAMKLDTKEFNRFDTLQILSPRN